MEKQFAIFDMDGTLVDSMAYWRDLGREYLDQKGIREGREEVLEAVRGMTMTESAGLFYRHFPQLGSAKQVASEMNAIMEGYYKSCIPLKTGIREYLEALREAGVQMCVASATAEELVRLCLNRLGIGEFFSFFLSCEQIGIGKDKPDIYLMAAERFGAVPEAVAVYEDAPYAIKTAKAAGFYVVAVYDAISEKRWDWAREQAHESIVSYPEANIQK